MSRLDLESCVTLRGGTKDMRSAATGETGEERSKKLISCIVR